MTGSALREVTPSRLTLERRFTRSDLQKDIAEKQADGLRLLVEVGGHGAFVAAFRNRAEIVLAHVNRQSSNSTAGPFP
jgi:CHAT domain-containing protein